MSYDPRNLIFRFLTDDGTTSGNASANGDYSGAAEDFYYECEDGFTAHIQRMLIHIQDAGSFDSGSYGNGIALTNGIEILVLDDAGATIQTITDVKPIKTNTHWGAHCYDISLSSFGSGNSSLNARVTFSKSGQSVDLKPGQRLAVRVNDDLTGLTDHSFVVHGHKTNK